MNFPALSNTVVCPLLILAEVAAGQSKIGLETQQQIKIEGKGKMGEAAKAPEEKEPLPPLLLRKTLKDSAQAGPSSPSTASGTPKTSKRRRSKYPPILPRPPAGSIILIPKPAPPPIPDPAKKFKCDQCPRAYTKETYLRAHKLAHQGVRRHACPRRDCGRTFVRKDQLARHSLVHTEERKYHCTLCNSRFRRSDHLLKHNRTQHHSGLRRSMRRKANNRQRS